MAESNTTNKGFGGGPALPHDPSKGEGPGGFRTDATNVPTPADDAVTPKVKKKAEEPKAE